MNKIIETYEKEQIQQLTTKKGIPTFRPGDTIKVSLKIVEGERSRIQVFEGVCIARKNNGLNSNFTIRKLSHGEGVERVFPLFSPLIDKIEVVRKGDVRRAKLYYLRDRKGKNARIVDSDRGDEADQYALVETIEEKTNNEEKNQKEENPVKKESQTNNGQEDEKKSSSSEQIEPKKIDDETKPVEENNENKSDQPSAEVENSDNESKT